MGESKTMYSSFMPPPSPVFSTNGASHMCESSRVSFTPSNSLSSCRPEVTYVNVLRAHCGTAGGGRRVRGRTLGDAVCGGAAMCTVDKPGSCGGLAHSAWVGRHLRKLGDGGRHAHHVLAPACNGRRWPAPSIGAEH